MKGKGIKGRKEKKGEELNLYQNLKGEKYLFSPNLNGT